jgi:hypothetical protein
MRKYQKEAKKCRVLVRPEDVDKIVKFHRSLFDSTAKVRSNPTARRLKPKIVTLRKAQHLLESMRYVLALDMPHRDLCYTGALILLQAGQKYLSSLASTGSVRETLGGPGACACKLAALYKERTGNSHWEEVGKALAKGFPELLRSKKKDDEPDLLRLWALKLAQRYEKAANNKKWSAPLNLGFIESNYRTLQGEKTKVEQFLEKIDADVTAMATKWKQDYKSTDSVENILKRYADAVTQKYF